MHINFFFTLSFHFLISSDSHMYNIYSTLLVVTFFGSQTLYTDSRLHRGLAPQPSIVQGSAVPNIPHKRKQSEKAVFTLCGITCYDFLTFTKLELILKAGDSAL